MCNYWALKTLPNVWMTLKAEVHLHIYILTLKRNRFMQQRLLVSRVNKPAFLPGNSFSHN